MISLFSLCSDWKYNIKLPLNSIKLLLNLKYSFLLYDNFKVFILFLIFDKVLVLSYNLFLIKVK